MWRIQAAWQTERLASHYGACLGELPGDIAPCLLSALSTQFLQPYFFIKPLLTHRDKVEGEVGSKEVSQETHR